MPVSPERNMPIDPEERLSILQINLTYVGHEAELVSILGWAAQRGIPFQEAVSTLLGHRTAMETNSPAQPTLYGSFSSFIGVVIWGTGSWKTQIGLVVRDLENGKPLSVTLRKRLSRYLSAYYLAAVERAEKDRMLPEILPQLAANMKFSNCVRESFKASVTYPIVQFSTAMAVIFGLYIFIIPRFEKIFAELLGETPFPPLLSLITRISKCSEYFFIDGIGNVLFFIMFSPMIAFDKICSEYHLRSNDTLLLVPIILQLIFFFAIPLIYMKIIIRVLRVVFSPLADFASFLVLHIPFIGRHIRRIALLEIAGAMATLTGAGFDVAEAAKWNAETVKWRWVRKKLAKFADSVQNGEYWADAWAEMKLGSPAQEWIIRNAASREKPRDGFRLLASWLSTEINSSNHLFISFTEVSCIVLNACLVGITIFAVWQALWMLIYGMVEI